MAATHRPGKPAHCIIRRSLPAVCDTLQGDRVAPGRAALGWSGTRVTIHREADTIPGREPHHTAPRPSRRRIRRTRQPCICRMYYASHRRVAPFKACAVGQTTRRAKVMPLLLGPSEAPVVRLYPGTALSGHGSDAWHKTDGPTAAGKMWSC